MKAFPEILTQFDISEQNASFRKALFNLKPKDINRENFGYLIEIYQRSKQEYIKYKCLILLYNKRFESLKEFFESVYKKSRKFTLKIQALRGLAQFLSEDEISLLVEKFIQQLNKSIVSTPYDYTSLEALRGWNALPYLRLKYRYACFRKFHWTVRKHYWKLPFAFKYHYWIDSNGKMKEFPWSHKSHDRMERFFANRR